MKAIELISFLGKSVDDVMFREFLETHHFNTKKFPKPERVQKKSSNVISKLHGTELRFGFEKEVLELYEIIFSKPQSDGLQPVYKIDYPFGLFLNQKMADYEKILGKPVGYIEPQLQEYRYKNYAITIVFEPAEVDKKIMSIEIRLKL